MTTAPPGPDNGCTSVSSADTTATVVSQLAPDPEDPTARQLCWDVDVAGQTQRCLVDTGAARSTLWRAPGLRPAGDVDPAAGRGVSGQATGGELAVAPTLSVAGLLLARDLVVELADPTSRRPPLLGADALQGHTLHWEFEAGRCTIDGPRPPGGFDLELERPGLAPFVEVRAEELHTRACWDTGAGVTIVDLPFARAHPQVFTLSDGSAPGTDAAGQPVAGVPGTMGPVRIGGALFGACDVVAVDLAGLNAHLAWPLTLILGLPLLAQADWWFDFPGNAWAITRRPGA